MVELSREARRRYAFKLLAKVSAISINTGFASNPKQTSTDEKRWSQRFSSGLPQHRYSNAGRSIYRRSICAGRIDRFNLVQKVAEMHRSGTRPRLRFSAWEILARSEDANRENAAASMREESLGTDCKPQESRGYRESSV